MRTLIIATQNKGKFPEIVSKLKDLPFAFKNLSEAGYSHDFAIDEPGHTFEGNAVIKAMTIGKQTNQLTLAEDAGLEVDALNGRPGVWSARYAPGTDEDRYKKLLDELKSVDAKNRTARFVAVTVVYDPDNDKVLISEGVSEGSIALEPRGENGFGYDPIFVSKDLEKTNAELTREEKNRISHRGKALTEIQKLLLEEYK